MHRKLRLYTFAVIKISMRKVCKLVAYFYVGSYSQKLDSNTKRHSSTYGNVRKK